MAFRSERHHARIHSNTLNEDRIRKDAHAIEIDQHRRVADPSERDAIVVPCVRPGCAGGGQGITPKIAGYHPPNAGKAGALVAHPN